MVLISLLLLFQALLHRELAVMGEERFLRSTLKEQLPSWLTFPDVERVEWINSIVAAIWPHVGLYADKVLREVVEPMAIEALEDYKVKPLIDPNLLSHNCPGVRHE